MIYMIDAELGRYSGAAIVVAPNKTEARRLVSKAVDKEYAYGEDYPRIGKAIPLTEWVKTQEYNPEWVQETKEIAESLQEGQVHLWGWGT